jgi:Zn-dependent membrane protease YugP
MVPVFRSVALIVILIVTSGAAAQRAAEAYKQFQKSTAIKGWTGVRSALMNPIVLGTNAVNRNKHRRKLQGGS